MEVGSVDGAGVDGIVPGVRPGTRRPFKPPSSKRQQITAAEAIEIYKLRPSLGEAAPMRCRRTCISLCVSAHVLVRACACAGV